MNIAPVRAIAIVLAAVSLCACEPGVTVPMSGHWAWVNSNAAYTASLETDRLACSAQAADIQARLSKCEIAKPLDCESMTNKVDQAMCRYSNSTTKNMCDVGRMNIPKQEIIDGCVSARGWTQAWINTGM